MSNQKDENSNRSRQTNNFHKMFTFICRETSQATHHLKYVIRMSTIIRLLPTYSNTQPLRKSIIKLETSVFIMIEFVWTVFFFFVFRQKTNDVTYQEFFIPFFFHISPYLHISPPPSISICIILYSTLLSCYSESSCYFSHAIQYITSFAYHKFH